MPFNQELPQWNAVGDKPPQSKLDSGWQIGERPPAGWWNWLLNRTHKAIEELQNEAINIDQKGVANGVATLGADGKVPASQLNVSAPADATTTQKGVVQLSNSTTSTSETLAATPKAVKDAKDGLSTQIGILSGLNTTAKENLVSAVNELFTFANDGKSKWSSVIGSPLVSGDTFAQMQTKTQTIKNTLATNLTAKGQSSVGTETLTALADKVANVVTGKKFAEGTATGSSSELSFTRYQGTSMNRLYLTVSGLAFTPSYILIRKINQDNFSVSYDSRRPNNNTITIQDSETSGSIFKSTGSAYVNSTGFRLPVSNNEFNASYQWIAVE